MGPDWPGEEGQTGVTERKGALDDKDHHCYTTSVKVSVHSLHMHIQYVHTSLRMRTVSIKPPDIPHNRIKQRVCADIQ